MNLDQKLRIAAQRALDDIGSTRTLTPLPRGNDHSQHVFNNGVLKFHIIVLEDLLKDLRHYHEEMNNLKKYLYIPLSEPQQDAIKKMVTSFSPEEGYVDYNAIVYGEYMRQLRQALVAYLKAHTSDNEADRSGIHEIHQQVINLSSKMAKHDVYVDGKAHYHWLQDSRNQVPVYNDVRDALRNMFQNILNNFESVSDKIRGLRVTNWNR